MNSHENEGVLCSVVNCRYHCNGDHCSADKINVGNPSACQCSETLCSTFEKK